jgi:hypothetical protein
MRLTEVVRILLVLLGVVGIAWGIRTLRVVASQKDRAELPDDLVRGIVVVGGLRLIGGVAWLIAGGARAEWAAWVGVATVLGVPVARFILARRHVRWR